MTVVYVLIFIALLLGAIYVAITWTRTPSVWSSSSTPTWAEAPVHYWQGEWLDLVRFCMVREEGQGGRSARGSLVATMQVRKRRRRNDIAGHPQLHRSLEYHRLGTL